MCFAVPVLYVAVPVLYVSPFSLILCFLLFLFFSFSFVLLLPFFLLSFFLPFFPLSSCFFLLQASLVFVNFSSHVDMNSLSLLTRMVTTVSLINISKMHTTSSRSRSTLRTLRPSVWPTHQISRQPLR